MSRSRKTDTVYWGPAGGEMVSRTPGAFTLVELLVVIGTIALLMGITLPALSGARKSARRAVCAANLRQVGLAVQMYLSDHSNRLPNARFLPEPIAGGYQRRPLNEILRRYLPWDDGETSEVYACPGDRALYEVCGMSYAYEVWISGEVVSDLTELWGANLSEIWLMYDGDDYRYDLTDGAKLVVPRFHGRKRNSLYADGHVEVY